MCSEIQRHKAPASNKQIAHKEFKIRKTYRIVPTYDVLSAAVSDLYSTFLH